MPKKKDRSKGKKNSSKSDVVSIQIRRNGDVSLSKEQKQLIESYLGGQKRVHELAREYYNPSNNTAGVVHRETNSSATTKNNEGDNVRLILAQSPNQSKIIVVKRTKEEGAAIQEILTKGLNKLQGIHNRKLLNKANAVFVLSPNKNRIFHTLDVENDSMIIIEEVKNLTANETQVTASQGEETKIVEDYVHVDTTTPNTFKAAVERDEDEERNPNNGNVECDDFEPNDKATDGLEEMKKFPNDDDETESSIDDIQVEGIDDKLDDDEILILSGNQESEVETVPSSLYDRAKKAYTAGGNLQNNQESQPFQASGSSAIDFKSVRATRCELPIDKSELDLIKTINEHRVTIIRAPTGSGKSTRLVQFLLENQPNSQIIVTEPRRIAAMSVSERVAAELQTKIGQVVGYSIRAENVSSKSTQILFCTVGVLLRRLAHDPTLDKISHVIVDEAHERDVLTDLLLIFLRDLLSIQGRTDLRVIILSATLDSSAFRDYFVSVGEQLSLSTVAEVQIEGRTFPIDYYFLEQLEQMVGPYNNNSNEQRATAAKIGTAKSN